MTVKEYFIFEESPYNPGYYTLNINYNVLPSFYTEGSVKILPARLLHLDYADFCRLCRDEFNARVIGKNSKYPIVYFFKPTAELKMFAKLLNSRLSAVLWAVEHPDWREHEEFLRGRAQ